MSSCNASYVRSYFWHDGVASWRHELSCISQVGANSSAVHELRQSVCEITISINFAQLYLPASDFVLDPKLIYFHVTHCSLSFS